MLDRDKRPMARNTSCIAGAWPSISGMRRASVLASSTRVEVVAETDGVFSETAPEVGNYSFAPAEINGGDCFHPSIAGQNKLSTVIWGNDPYTVRR